MVFSSFVEGVIITFFLALPMLYENFPTFKYYLKFFLYYIIVMATAVLVLPVMLFRPREVKNLLLASRLCRHISSLLGLRWELRGKEYLEKDQACVIVANHQSSLDILGMFEIWPVMNKCTAVAKKELLYTGPFGIAAWLCGLVFIDRRDKDKAKESINNATQYISEKKIKLWIFPEGTRNNNRSMLPFKKGAFHVAISAQLPILPVVFSSYYFLDHPAKRLDPGHVIISVLPPVPTVGKTTQEIAELMKSVRNDMIKEYHTISGEVSH